MTDHEPIQWIYKCGSGWKRCNDGFCERYNQLNEEGNNPAEYMSLEWEDVTGKKWNPNAIRQRFHQLTVTKDNGHGGFGLSKRRKISQTSMWEEVESRLSKIVNFIERNYEQSSVPANGRRAEMLGSIRLIKTYINGLEG